MDVLVSILFIVYCTALTFVLAYSLVQAHLIYRYVKQRHSIRAADAPPLTTHPRVTVQLPVYNERYVVERLLDAVAAFDYPRDRLQIQVLDDSTDETVQLITDKVAALQRGGYAVQYVRRPHRTGYKAGALAEGLQSATGEFTAIFDADFVPPPDFLQRTIPHFSDARIGMVQTRWQHLNEHYSWLTRLQAFALNAHFTVEQSGRNAGGFFINFNGTGGVWRKSCIEDAGGWNADTLTEDLDLSYRAQLNGWRFRYLEHVGSPAELPPVMSAIKSQQYRWTKGGAENARKHLGHVFHADIPFSKKLHAVFHLLNTCLFVCTIVCAVLSVPLLLVQHYLPEYNAVFSYTSVFLLSLIILGVFYWVAGLGEFVRKKEAIGHFLVHFPLFLSVSMGLSLHNTVAVIEGWLGIKTPFIRTPKFNLQRPSDTQNRRAYLTRQIGWLTILEGLLAVYFLSGIVLACVWRIFGWLPMHVLLTFGFSAIVYYTVAPLINAPPPAPAPVSRAVPDDGRLGKSEQTTPV